MGQRLRLAQGLAEGTLSPAEMIIAKDNPVIVKEAARLKAEAQKPKTVKRKTVKKEVTNG